MFEEIITSKEIKFNDLEKKVFKFVSFLGCLIIKLMLEAYDRKLMENRDKKKYRHKGLRETSVNTVMGEIKYKRVMYEVQEEGITKTVYLLDETLKISVEGKVSSNLVEKVVETVPITDSYRKAEEVIDITTNTSLSHEKIRDPRHSLVNKQYIAGIMKPKEIAKIRDARVFTKYDESKIKLRVTNGDGAKWTKGITVKGGIYQKDQFHIMQEIVRDVPKEYRNIFTELINKKQFHKIQSAIDGLKYELEGEYQAVKKLNKLESYLSGDLERYQDIVEVPEAPEGIEYRNMGTQESQIFSKLKKRFCSGRKAFSIYGANALSKVCVLSEKFKIDELETPIPIDTSVEDWIKEIENEVKLNRQHRSNRIETEENKPIKNVIVNSNWIKEIMKMKEFSEMRCSF